jgi:hypothetical protein
MRDYQRILRQLKHFGGVSIGNFPVLTESIPQSCSVERMTKHPKRPRDPAQLANFIVQVCAAQDNETQAPAGNLPADTRFGATYQLLLGQLGPCARPPLGRAFPRERID